MARPLEEGFPGSSWWRRRRSGRWAVLGPAAAQPAHSQRVLERSSQEAGADSTGELSGPGLFRQRMRALQGVGRPRPSPSPGHAGQPHEWDVGLRKELESPPPSGGVSLWSSQHQVGALWTQHRAGLRDTAKEAGRGGSTGRAECCCPGQEVGQRRAQWLSLAWVPGGRGCPSRALLHVPPPVLGTLSPNPRPTYLLDLSFSFSHVASTLPLEVGPASTPIPQTGLPLGVW